MRGWPGLISFFTALFFLRGFLIAQQPRPTAPGTQFEPPNAIPHRRTRLKRSEVEFYKSARTLISWSPSEIDSCAFLHGLRPSVSQDQLPGILERVGQTCTGSYHDFLDVTCDEEVVSTGSNVSQGYLPGFFPGGGEACSHNLDDIPKLSCNEGLSSKGSNSYPAVRSNFQYTVLRRPQGDLPEFEEYRTDLRGKPVNVRKLRNPPVMTWGFASTFLYFSLADQRDNRYRYFGTQMIRDRECHVVGFAQDPENVGRIYRIYFFGKHGRVVLLQGMAWIDVQDFRILRVKIWLLAPHDDVRLSSETSTVDFYPFHPSGTERELWLPYDVLVEALFRGLEVHNTHHYANYKLFRVESTIKP